MNFLRIKNAYLIFFVNFIYTFEYYNSQPSDFELSALNSLNKIRSYYQVNALKLNINLTNSARNYANLLSQSDAGTISGSDSDIIDCATDLFNKESLSISDTATPRCGENLAFAQGTSSDDFCKANIIIQIWESEKFYYNYSYPPSDETSKDQVKYFTQMVWYVNYLNYLK
jgi:hypothetical protein